MEKKLGGNMDVNIYRTYKFDFDPDVYLREFKKALDESGVTKPALFYQMLKDVGIRGYNYETVKSYYYGRRVPPLNIFIAVCKSLELNADKIAFPESIQNPEYNSDLRCSEDTFRNVFHPYNYSDKEDDFADLDLLFREATYKSDVEEVALVLSKYNYLIQKYHYASVSLDERDQIYEFTERYILDRSNGTETDPNKIMEWMRSSKDVNFLDEFYSKYTIGFYGKSCHHLLKILSNAISSNYIRCAAELLPRQDMF